MTIVIEISEELYKHTHEVRGVYPCSESYEIYKAIRDGVELPKGHGRLIDAKEFEAYIRDGFRDLKGEFKTEKFRNLAEQLTESFLMDIQEQATVVPADEEESE